MSSGGARKAADIKKAQYYVWYLGWKEIRGLWGREFTEPITKELVQIRANEALPKLTIEVNRKEVRVVQLIEKKKGKVEKVKYPPIPAKDVTYAVQARSPDEDVVSCIYLGYNPQTRCAVHVHVYQCDSPETAEIFSDHLTQLTELPDHQARIMRIEADLVAKNQVVMRPSAYVGAAVDDASTIGPSVLNDSMPEKYDEREDTRHAKYDSRESRRSNEPLMQAEQPIADDKDVVDIYDCVTSELKAKLKVTAPPMLYPPKDYDTVHRNAGNLITAEEIRRAQISEDSARGDSERGSKDSHRVSSNGSRGSYGADNPEDAEVQAITPRWKAPAQTYLPPSSPTSRSPVSGMYDPSMRRARPISSGDRSSGSGPHSARPPSRGSNPTGPPNNVSKNPQHTGYASGSVYAPKPVYGLHDQRQPAEYSPAYHAPSTSRPLSPPPELKKSSYFPPAGSSALPGYLQATLTLQGSSHNSDGSDGNDGPRGKKYTASNLGLTDKPRPMEVVRNPPRPREEGYFSLDRRDPSQDPALLYDEQYGTGNYFRSYGPRVQEDPYVPAHVMTSLAPPRRPLYGDHRTMPHS